MSTCQNNNINTEIKIMNNVVLNQVHLIKYLDSYISSSVKDFNLRNGMGWTTSNDKHKIWARVELKVQIFKTKVVSLLLYVSGTWIMLEDCEKIRLYLHKTYMDSLWATIKEQRMSPLAASTPR